jgi:hypothetical protein
MARAVQRQIRSEIPLVQFIDFPRHWLPLFEWSRCPWRGTIEPENFVPLISGRSEEDVLLDIARARQSRQLRLLVDVIASSEVVISETLQRIDGRLAACDFYREAGVDIKLTTWHSYNRADVRSYDELTLNFCQRHSGVLFIPCSKKRPYPASATHRRLLQSARENGIDIEHLDKIVITSLGPVPEQYWDNWIVKAYDTGIRDIYRLFLQLKNLLRNTTYTEAWDLMSFAPYSDILRLCHLEGLLPPLQRLGGQVRRNIPIYRPQAAPVRS